jgi:general secretion pathway protein A
VYNAFFKLNDAPFRLTPDSASLYMTVQHREALSGLVHSVCNHSGLTVLVGEAGTGKTTLIQAIRGWLEKLNFVVAICTNPILSREELYDLLLTQLRVECPSTLKSRQLFALEQTLQRYRSEQRRAVLIVDEAHRLSPELLEEVRLLLNLETPREKLLEIIIAGQPELMDLLRRPDLRQLKQRVSCFCRLHPLTSTEIGEYINHRLARVGRTDGTLFPQDTVELIHHCTNGIPRLVNNLCDGALRTAFALEAQRVTCSIVSEAAEDLDLEMSPLKAPFMKLDVPAPAPAAAPAVQMAGRHPAATHAANGTDRAATRPEPMTIPLESYANRQKSLNFLAGLMDRWK